MFPREDRLWSEVRDFLAGRLGPEDALLAPNEFLEFFPQTYAYRACHAVPAEHFAVAVLHKAMLDELPRAHLATLLAARVPIFANEVFVVLARKARWRDRPKRRHVKALRAFASRLPARAAPDGDGAPRTAVVVTTFARPHALERSLPQIARLGVPVLVVDDGSPAPAAEQAAKLCDTHGASHLRLPENRGLPAALNAGVSYWLADPGVGWISCFQDDVDVRPDALEWLARVQHPHERPFLTGRLDPLHPHYGEAVVGGARVVRMRSIPGVHMHGHRDYWSAVLPIPTPYLGAPKPDGGLAGQGSDEDFWASAWSPRSIAKRGRFALCVPGLVRTFASGGDESTWGNGQLPGADPPLPPEGPAPPSTVTA